VVVYLNWSVIYLWAATHLFSCNGFWDKAKAAARHLGAWREVIAALRSIDLKGVTKALREFCDANDAYLVAKYRWRDTPLEPERRIADKIVFDECYYPHTIMELMSIATLCVGYMSFGVREAVASGVPYIMLDVGGLTDLDFYGEGEARTFKEQASPGGVFNYPGVVHLLDEKRVRTNLPRMKLAECALDRAAWNVYYEKYLGVPGTHNSQLFLNAVEAVVAGECLEAHACRLEDEGVSLASEL
jgi:hypothetical protein